jgi:hypothetical protein
MKFNGRCDINPNQLFEEIRLILNEETTLRGTNTPEFKEGLVVYFTSLPSDKLVLIESKLQKKEIDQKKLTIPLPKSDIYYGKKSYDLVVSAIKHLSGDIVKKSELGFYYNALSVAKKIQEIYGGPIQSDRGDQIYSKLRSKAVELIKDGYGVSSDSDKWCPADIYIYNDKNVVSRMMSAKTINVGKDSFNAQFQSNLNKTSSGLTAISLKEEKAQAGKATSFFGTLERKENYPDAPKLSGDSKYVLSIAYNYDQAVRSVNKDPQKAIGYIATAHASAQIVSSKLKEAAAVEKDMLKILNKTFGNDGLQSIKNRNGRYDKQKSRELFAEKGIDSFVIPPVISTNIDKLFEVVRTNYETNYKKARKSFLDILRKNNMEVPSQTPDVKSMNMETLLKKTSCYMIASWVLDGINSQNLNIPPIYQSIIKEKNAFVAMTAYAIGMSGISPTFFKMVGDSKGGMAHVETFYGSGVLNLDEKENVIIGDSPKRKGFFIDFITNVKLEENKSSKTVSRYKVSLDFRYSGEQINIEVSELKAI